MREGLVGLQHCPRPLRRRDHALRVPTSHARVHPHLVDMGEDLRFPCDASEAVGAEIGDSDGAGEALGVCPLHRLPLLSHHPTRLRVRAVGTMRIDEISARIATTAARPPGGGEEPGGVGDAGGRVKEGEVDGVHPQLL